MSTINVPTSMPTWLDTLPPATPSAGTTPIVSPITGATIAVPTFDRTWVKCQPAGDRKFTAGGAKGDAIAAAVWEGGHTRDDIAKAVGASVSRVGEVVWVMEANIAGFKAVFPRKK